MLLFNYPAVVKGGPYFFYPGHSSHVANVKCKYVLMEGANPRHGHEVDAFEHAIAKGIIDPTKVVRSAVQNATSVAALLMSTDTLIANIPEEEAAGHADDRHTRMRRRDQDTRRA